MHPFGDQFGYNSWATQRLIESMRGLEDAKLQQPMEGIYGSPLQTLRHLLQVEDGYLELLGARPRVLPREAGFGQCLALAPSIEGAYVDFAIGLSDEGLARMVPIPWFERSVSVADALLQVFTHSVEHRADLASALTRVGASTPPIEYVLWAFERDGHPVSVP